MALCTAPSSSTVVRAIMYFWVIYSVYIMLFSGSIIGSVMGAFTLLFTVEALRGTPSLKTMHMYIGYCFTNGVVSLALGLVIVSGFHLNCYKAENSLSCIVLSQQYGILMFVVGAIGGFSSGLVLFVTANQTKFVRNCWQAWGTDRAA